MLLATRHPAALLIAFLIEPFPDFLGRTCAA